MDADGWCSLCDAAKLLGWNLGGIDLGLMRGSSVQEPEHFSNEHIWLGCDNYFIIISAARLSIIHLRDLKLLLPTPVYTTPLCQVTRME